MGPLHRLARWESALKSSYIHAGKREEVKRLESQSKLFKKQLSSTFRLLGIVKNVSVLEVGCGSGAVAREIARKVNPSAAVAVDIDPLFLKEARLVAEKKGIRNLSFKRSDAYHLKLPSNSFDVTFCRLLLMHLDNPLIAVREMRRVTKPGGKVGAWEIDDGVSLTYPELPKGDEVSRKIKSWLKENYSVDTEIGRKLNSILMEAGLKEITLHPFCICMNQTEYQIRKLSYEFRFARPIALYKTRLLKDGVVTERELEAADKEGKAFAESPKAFALFSSFLAVGEK
jgi:ubiquinone/menaquinone biosynthesis C-methylase UbiE